MKQKLTQQVHETLMELIRLFATVDPHLVNVVPFPGSWTAGQLAKHMIMSNGGFAEMMAGPTQETDREPDEKVDAIRSTFLNFSIKFQSPDFIKPPKMDYQKDDLIEQLSGIERNLQSTIESSDLSKTCTLFEVPALGYLTRLEAAHFVLCHTKRHIHQLRNIIMKLSGMNIEAKQQLLQP